MNEDFLLRKLHQRMEGHAYRELQPVSAGTDFSSNDYLGIVKHGLLDTGNETRTEKMYGSAGSRLISGNYPLIVEAEEDIAAFHGAEAGLIFNSGYDANAGLLGCLPQRSDTVLYDSLCHASIRDGIRMGYAYSFSFQHNNMDDLEKRLQSATGNIFVVTESVFSMDGEVAPLETMAEICDNYNALLIVDEAHATGVIGEKGEGLAQRLGMEKKCFARVHTFSKAVGCHGAIVLGSSVLRNYLINFCRPFIYTTALPASSIMAIRKAYGLFPGMTREREQLNRLIALFRSAALAPEIIDSKTPIQAVIIPGNEEVKRVAAHCREKGLDVRPILHPSVPKERERLRVVLHAYNTAEEVNELVSAVNSAAL